MNRLIATNDITDDHGFTIVPRGTVLELQNGVYTGRNSLTGNRVRMSAEWAEDEVYMEYLQEVNE